MSTAISWLEKGYGFIAFITMLLGVVTGVLFFISLIIGGSAGQSLAVFAGEAMMMGIKLASLAVVLGIGYIYASKTHTLKIGDEKKAVTKSKVVTSRKEKVV